MKDRDLEPMRNNDKHTKGGILNLLLAEVLPLLDDAELLEKVYAKLLVLLDIGAELLEKSRRRAPCSSSCRSSHPQCCSP